MAAREAEAVLGRDRHPEGRACALEDLLQDHVDEHCSADGENKEDGVPAAPVPDQDDHGQRGDYRNGDPSTKACEPEHDVVERGRCVVMEEQEERLVPPETAALPDLLREVAEEEQRKKDSEKDEQTERKPQASD